MHISVFVRNVSQCIRHCFKFFFKGFGFAFEKKLFKILKLLNNKQLTNQMMKVPNHIALRYNSKCNFHKNILLLE